MSTGARRLKPSEQVPASRYELLVRLAAGGMGSVYIGTSRGTDLPLYAIKRAHAHLAEDADFRRMFLAEAQLASQIRCRGAIGVIDVDEADGEVLMVMPFVEGGSFSDMLVATGERGRRIAPQITLRIVLDAARGLDAAHRLTDESGRPLGIVHRDVSPHNILVGLDGTSSIVDFGVAKAVAADLTQTATGVLKGKSAYMAPEYLKSRVANARTDLFGLGVVAWEALANRRLFKCAEEAETVLRVLSDAPAPMLTELVAIDATIAAVVARALAKDPAKRFADPAEFADALERAARAADMLAQSIEVGASVKSLLGREIEERRNLVREALAERRPVVTASMGSVTELARTLAQPSAFEPEAITDAMGTGHLGAPRTATPAFGQPVPGGSASDRRPTSEAERPLLLDAAFDSRKTVKQHDDARRFASSTALGAGPAQAAVLPFAPRAQSSGSHPLPAPSQRASGSKAGLVAAFLVIALLVAGGVALFLLR